MNQLYADRKKTAVDEDRHTKQAICLKTVLFFAITARKHRMLDENDS